jgi:phosphoribosylformylglycinamidine synthase
MKFLARVDIMPREEILDPQGKTVALGLAQIGIEGLEDVRIGKHMVLRLDAPSQEEARKTMETACQKLLANPVMEYYEVVVEPTE